MQNSGWPKREHHREVNTSAGLPGVSGHSSEKKQGKDAPGWGNSIYHADLCKTQKTVRKADYCYKPFRILVNVRDYLRFSTAEIKNSGPQ